MPRLNLGPSHVLSGDSATELCFPQATGAKKIYYIGDDDTNYICPYPTGRKFSLEFKLKLHLNPAYYYIFRNLSIVAYMIQKSKFANIWIHEFDQSEPGR